MAETPLSSYLARWEAAFADGRDVPAEELCPDDPALAADLRQVIDALRLMKRHLSQAGAPVEADPYATQYPAGDGPPPSVVAISDPLCPAGYRLVRRLAKGGQGVVYLAWQERLSRQVALKVLDRDDNPTAQARFLADAEAIAAVRHPGIVQVYDYGTHAGVPYFALEFCAGGSLADRLAGTPLPAQEAARVVEQVARAVQAAHDRGIVHRDLKPHNVLLTGVSDGSSRTPDDWPVTTVKVTDFGLAKRVEGGGGLTATGAVLGTPSYMAPEQASDKVGPVGPLADVYGLGAVLYECLTGRPPFRAADVVQTLLQVVADDPVVPPRQLNPAVPADMETICLKCLRKAPAERYGSAAAVAEDLRRWRCGEPIAARPAGRVERAWKAVRRRPVVSSLVALTAVSLLVGTAVSTYFGVQAQHRAQEAKEALASVEETLAAGLMRPLGHGKTSVLNLYELDALEELASLPSGRERVRVLFLAQALLNEREANQFAGRAEVGIYAAIGCRTDIRDRVEELMGRTIEEERLSQGSSQLLAASLIRAMLDSPNYDETFTNAIVDEISNTILDGDRYSLDLAISLAHHLPVDQGAALAARIVGSVSKAKTVIHLARLTKAFVAFAPKLSPEQAHTHASSLFHRGNELKKKTNDSIDINELARLAAIIIPWISIGSQEIVLWDILDLADRTTKPEVLNALAEGSVSRIATISHQQAATLATNILKVETSGPSVTGRRRLIILSRMFNSLSTKLSHDNRSKLASRLAGNAFHAPPSSDSIWLATSTHTLAAVAPELPAEIVSKLADDQISRFVQLPRQFSDPAILTPLTAAFAVLAAKLSAEQSARLGAQVVRLGAETTDADAQKSLAQAYAALAHKLPPDHANNSAANMTARIARLAAKTTDPDELRKLVQAFGVLAYILHPIQAATQGNNLATYVAQLSAQAEAPHELA